MPTKKPQKTTIKKSTLIAICIISVVVIAALITLVIILATKNDTSGPSDSTISQQEQKAMKIRDTQRQDDLARALTSVINFQKSNRGRIPSFEDSSENNRWGSCDKKAATGFCKNYLLAEGDTFADPSGTPYVFQNASDQSGSEKLKVGHKIYIYTGSTCDGSNAIGSTGSRKLAFRIKLESGETICMNN